MEHQNYVLAEETYGSSELGLKKLYVSVRTGTRNNLVSIQKSGQTKTWISFRSFLTEAFLPLGYPQSVSNDYFEYQLWDSLQAFFNSLTCSLSTQAVLKGVGVGDQTATVMGATLTWLLKDGSGMIGRILFAWLQGAQLDCNCKKWRLFADVINDIAMFIDLISPCFPNYFTPIICTSSVIKAIVGVAGGATRAALTQHQARRNNMADVSAKDGSQETMVQLIALMCSLVLIPLIADNNIVVWILFMVFTTLHLFSNYMAVRSVCMESLNVERYKILLNHYLKTGNLLSVEITNKLESVWLSFKPQKVNICLGAPLSRFIYTTEDLSFYRTVYKDSQYILGIVKEGKAFWICISLQKDATPKTLLEAMYQAIIIETDFLERLFRNNRQSREILNRFDKESERQMILLSKQFTSEGFDNFLNKTFQSGWITSHVLFGANEYTFKWN